AHSCGTPAGVSLLNGLLEKLQNRIKSKEAHKEDLISILASLDRRTTAATSIFKDAKEFLTGTLETLDDFREVSAFIMKFPGAVRTEELEEIKQQFWDFSKEYAD